MRLQDIQNLTMSDVDHLSTKEIQQIVQYNKKILIRRYKTQKSKMGEVAPIFKGKEGSPYMIKTTKISRNKLIEQMRITTAKTKSVTTTVSGFKHWIKEQEKAVGEKHLSEKQLKKIWDMYDKIEEMHPDLFYKIDYKEIIKKIREFVTNNKFIGIKAIDKKLKEFTAEQSEEMNEWVNKHWNGIEEGE